MLSKRFSIGVLVALTMVAAAAPARATTILSPIAVTGYNHDYVYGPDGGVGGGFADLWVNNFFAAGAVDKSGVAHSDGMPIGNFASAADANHTYRLADAGGNAESDNVLQVNMGTSGTLTLATPGKYDTIGVLLTCWYGLPGSIVLNYSDSTSSVATAIGVPDWHTGGANAACSFSRSDVPTGLDNFVYDGGYYNGFHLYEFTVSADPTKTLVGVTFSNGSTSHDEFFALAVSGQAVPEPATGAILLTTGLIGLLCYAWRKMR